MVNTIYIIILSYFVLGAIGFYFINRKKAKDVARESWTKFITYFFIINILFFSIVINPILFRIASGLIVLVGAYELFRLLKTTNFSHLKYFLVSITIFGILSFGFIIFSGFNKEIILFTFLILSIFDAFSQISGQLFGKTKIVPNISPNKTIGGTFGGAIIAILSGLLLKGLYNELLGNTLILSTGIVVFAFLGDIAASLYKRKFEVKDYSKLIPGHGGFLDRFDSLIAGGAWVASFIYGLVFIT